VDFFEWKFFFKNPLATFRIGVLAEVFLMYFSIARIYNEQSIAFMPDILKNGLAPIVILLVTAAISYLIVRLYRKSKADLHSFPELGLFILMHNMLVYFIYTAYIVRF
jgi:positive regulator of sigma E activity